MIRSTPAPQSRPLLPAPGFFGSSAAAGMLLVAVLDGAHLMGQGAPVGESIPAALLLLVLLPALGMLGGTALGAGARLVEAAAGRWPLRGRPAAGLPLLAAVLSAVPLLLWVRSVYSGPRVSRWPWRPAAEGVSFAVLLLSVVLSIRLLLAMRDRPGLRRLVILPALVLSVFLHWADGHLYLRTYGQIHAALALASSALGAVAAGSLGIARLLPRPRALLLLSILAAAAGAGILASADRLRWTVLLRAPMGGKLVRLLDPFYGPGSPPAAPELTAWILAPPDLGREDRAPLLDRLYPGRRESGVLLITIDSLRPDRMGLYGDPRGATPNLDALGRGSVHFPETRAPYPGTRYSMAALLRSLHPACTPEFHADSGRGIPRQRAPTLTERLREAGWTTALFADLNEVDLAVPGIFGFFRIGMDRIRILPEPPEGGTSEPLAREVLEHLVGPGASRAFAWVHFNDPHGPYRAVPGFPFGSSEEERYLSEVAAADAAVGLLVEGLSRAGLLDRMVVVLHSDHGEEFGEHGGRFHLTTTYEEQIRVPLLIRVPGLAPGPAAAPATLLDVVPTLIELLDLPRDPSLHGRSLVPHLLDRALPLDRPVFSQVDRSGTTGSTVRAVTRGALKLILDLDSGSRELYDLARDPGEQRNLAGAGLPAEQELLGLVSAFMALPCAGPGAEVEEELERLAAGYRDLPSSGRRRARDLAARVAGDPGRRFFRSLLREGGAGDIVAAAHWLLLEEDGEGIRILVSLLGSPDPAKRAAAAEVLGLYRRGEARASLRRALADPDPGVRGAAAFSLSALGEEVSEEALRPLLSMPEPLQPFLGNLALALQGRGESGAVLEEALLRRVPPVNRVVLDHLERAPRAGLLPVLAAVQADPYQAQEIRSHATRAIGRVDHPDALRALARIERNPSRAIAAPARQILEDRLRPTAADLDRLRAAAALLGDAEVLLLENAPERAAEALRKAVAADPGDVTARVLLARTLWNGGEEEAARRELEDAALERDAVLPRPGAAALLLEALSPRNGRPEARVLVESLEIGEGCFSGQATYSSVRIRNDGGVPVAGPLWRGGVPLRWTARDPAGTTSAGAFDEYPRGRPVVLAPGETATFEARFWPPWAPGVYEIRLGLQGAGDRTVAAALLVAAPQGADLREAIRIQALDLEIEGPSLRAAPGARIVAPVRVAYHGSIPLPGGDGLGSLSLTPVSRRTGKTVGGPFRFKAPLIRAGAGEESDLPIEAPVEEGGHDLDLVPALEGIGEYDPMPWTRIEIVP